MDPGKCFQLLRAGGQAHLPPPRGSPQNQERLGVEKTLPSWDFSISDLLLWEQGNSLTLGQSNGGIYSHPLQVLCVWGTRGPRQPKSRTDTLWLFQSESHHLTFAGWIVAVTQALALTHLSDGCLQSRCAPPPLHSHPGG